MTSSNNGGDIAQNKDKSSETAHKNRKTRRMSDNEAEVIIYLCAKSSMKKNRQILVGPITDKEVAKDLGYSKVTMQQKLRRMRKREFLELEDHGQEGSAYSIDESILAEAERTKDLKLEESKMKNKVEVVYGISTDLLDVAIKETIKEYENKRKTKWELINVSITNGNTIDINRDEKIGLFAALHFRKEK